MQLLLKIVAFSSKTVGSDRPVLTKGKRSKLEVDFSCCGPVLIDALPPCPHKKYRCCPEICQWNFLSISRFVVALVSFGMFIFISQLVGNLYINYLIMEVLTTARIPVTWFLFLK